MVPVSMTLSVTPHLDFQGCSIFLNQIWYVNNGTRYSHSYYWTL